MELRSAIGRPASIIIVLLGMCCGLLARDASAALGVPIVNPTHPTTQAPVTVTVRGGACVVLLADYPGRVIREGTHITLFAPGLESQIGGDFCLVPRHELTFSLGILEAGNYTLDVILEDRAYNDDQVAYGSIDFAVAKPFHIPATGTIAIVACMIGLLLIARVRHSGLAAILLVGLSVPESRAEAGSVHMLLSSDQGTVEPVDLVEGYSFASGYPPPIGGLTVESPLGIEYLVPARAKGKFAEYLESHPQLPRAKLERYVVINYPEEANLQNAIDALLANPQVEHAHIARGAESTSASEVSTWRARRKSASPDVASEEEGWSLLAMLDLGIATEHPVLRPFDPSGKYVGGSFRPALSFDAEFVGTNGCQFKGNCISYNVDDLEPLKVLAGSPCDSDGDGWAIPARAGHGTHVGGIIAAQASGASGFRGGCPGCSLAVWRIAMNGCSGDFLSPVIRVEAIDASVALSSQLGVQIINQSLTRKGIQSPDHCFVNPDNSECVALDYAIERDILLVAAAGNDHGPITFPASDNRVVSVGGAGDGGGLWDRSPGNVLDCPGGVGAGCGSNYTVDLAMDRRQEVMAPAESVLSTFYPGQFWNSSCSDALDGVPADGYGLCTGTSMAAPSVSATAGVLRSINPLVPVGMPDNAMAARGIRSVLRLSTLQSESGLPWSPNTGFGAVRAARAVRMMLGEVGGSRVRNRAIPLFALESTDGRDHAAVATPQMAVSLATVQAADWQTTGSTVAGYATFPGPDALDGVVPKANALVLSTRARTRSRQPALVPLYLLNRKRAWPLGCTALQSGCSTGHIDNALFTTTADVEAANRDGYRLLGRQGYVFARCSPEPSCMPAGSAKLYRKCKASDDDCAVFIESERTALEAQGFTMSYPAGSDPVLGYAIANIDSDGDTLVDGFEHLIGTNPAMADSDADGVGDGIEYPLAGVPVSDPCSGAVNGCDPPPFFDGFE